MTRFLAAACVLLVLAAELVSRFVFGLGDPPLFVLDPSIEYYYKPSRTYRRFGHTVSINSHSMRSPEFPSRRVDPRELRVMVVGDSIVTGGARIDQHELATSLLAPMLQRDTGRPVIVGNIAAASWGVPNQLAFLRRFGLFDADIVIVVLNSGDVDDVPGLEPLGYAWPTSTPLLALQEPVRRLTERYAPVLAERLGTVTPSRALTEDRKEVVRKAVTDLVSLVRSGPRPAVIGAVMYHARSELAGPCPGLDELQRTLAALNVPTWSSKASAAQPGLTDDPALFLSGDPVHPSALGHARLADVLRAAADVLAGQGQDPSAPPPNRDP